MWIKTDAGILANADMIQHITVEDTEIGNDTYSITGCYDPATAYVDGEWQEMNRSAVLGAYPDMNAAELALQKLTKDIQRAAKNGETVVEISTAGEPNRENVAVDGEVQSREEVAAAWNRHSTPVVSSNNRAEFMEFVYDELSDDADNCRANRIIDAADEYAESRVEKILPIPCTKVTGKTVKDWFAKIDEELNELKETVLVRFKTCDDADAWAKYSRQAETNPGNIAEEAADTITAITSMLEAMGIDEEQRQAAQREVNEKNRERGRF